jgi:hypothetical protein
VAYGVLHAPARPGMATAPTSRPPAARYSPDMSGSRRTRSRSMSPRCRMQSLRRAPFRTYRAGYGSVAAIRHQASVDIRRACALPPRQQTAIRRRVATGHSARASSAGEYCVRDPITRRGLLSTERASFQSEVSALIAGDWVRALMSATAKPLGAPSKWPISE